MTQDVRQRWEIQVTGLPGDSANIKHPLHHPPTTIYTWRHEWLIQVPEQLLGTQANAVVTRIVSGAGLPGGKPSPPTHWLGNFKKGFWASVNVQEEPGLSLVLTTSVFAPLVGVALWKVIPATWLRPLPALSPPAHIPLAICPLPPLQRNFFPLLGHFRLIYKSQTQGPGTRPKGSWCLREERLSQFDFSENNCSENPDAPESKSLRGLFKLGSNTFRTPKKIIRSIQPHLEC